MASVKNITGTISKRSLLTKSLFYTTAAETTTTTTNANKMWDHMPRKRRRLLPVGLSSSSNSNIILFMMLFIGCCACLNLIEAKMTMAVAATTKGVNIENIAELGNILDNLDDDNDKVNNDDLEKFEVQKPDATNDKNAIEKLEFKEKDEEENKRQPQELYNLRHRAYYQQQQHQLPKQNDHNAGQSNNNFNSYNYNNNNQERQLRYQQIQEALREPINMTPGQQQQQQQHHGHHEHKRHHQQHGHHQHHQSWPSHHIRHHRYYQRVQLPNLTELIEQQKRHNLTTQINTTAASILTTASTTTTTTTTTTEKPLDHRYYDRDSSYVPQWLPPTQGPAGHHKSQTNPHNWLFNDEEEEEDQNAAHSSNDGNGKEEIKRFSLSLDATDENEDTTNEMLDADDDDDDDDDDYSYESDDVDDDAGDSINGNSKNHKYSFMDENSKSTVKRYTMNNAMQQKSHRLKAKQHLRHNSAAAAAATLPHSQQKDRFKHNKAKHHAADDEEDYDNSNASSAEDTLTDEKWNKIQHEHYRKQLQHQKDMQALRSHRPNAGSSVTNGASAAATSHANAGNGANKRQTTLNEDDSENIYSRYYVPGSVTRKKEEELGSPTSVLEARRTHILKQRQNNALASAHHRRIATEGSCRLPQPRVERIRKDSWKIYTPHCTILHRCADDTGCCPSERQTCAAKRTKEVDLYFFVKSFNDTQGTIERLTFVNHTECHCVNRSKQPAPEYANDALYGMSTNQIPILRRATILNCNCPNLFEKILQEDGYCRCDCSSGNINCDWLKRGMEHFSMIDRKCILEGRCKLPTCEFGSYIKKLGRCPRREERLV